MSCYQPTFPSKSNRSRITALHKHSLETDEYILHTGKADCGIRLPWTMHNVRADKETTVPEIVQAGLRMIEKPSILRANPLLRIINKDDRRIPPTTP